jgi:hypothetical protein
MAAAGAAAGPQGEKPDLSEYQFLYTCTKQAPDACVRQGDRPGWMMVQPKVATGEFDLRYLARVQSNVALGLIRGAVDIATAKDALRSHVGSVRLGIRDGAVACGQC